MAENLLHEKECRICGIMDETESRLFSPCLCRGTMKHVHIHCLNRWRETSVNPNSKFKCEQCHYSYNIGRIWYANLIIHPITVAVITLTFITLSVLLVSYFIKLAAFLLLGARYGNSAWIVTRQLVWWAVLLIGFVFMLIIVFSTQERGNGEAFDAWGGPWGWGPGYYYPVDSAIFTFMGYTFSLSGFGLFVYSVYENVRQHCSAILVRTSQIVLEVRVPPRATE